MADVQVINNTDTHRFEVTLDGETAFAEYQILEEGLLLPHTVVPDAFAGKGVGSALAVTALSYARDHGMKVLPRCPFIAGYIKKHPEWHSIVHDTFKARLELG